MESEAAPIPDLEKEHIKQLIVSLVLFADRKIESLEKAINGNDFASVIVFLAIVNSLFKKFRYECNTRTILELKYCLDNFAALLLSTGEMPDLFVDDADKWMSEFKNYLCVRYTVVEDSGSDGLVLVDELREAVCDNISLDMEDELFEKYRVYIKSYHYEYEKVEALRESTTLQDSKKVKNDQTFHQVLEESVNKSSGVSKTAHADSMAGPVKQRNGFSILERFQEFIDIGQAMGYKMKGAWGSEEKAVGKETLSFESGKDYAKNIKSQSKPINIGLEIGSLHQKPDQRAFFYNNQANEAKMSKDSKFKVHSFHFSKVKVNGKRKMKVQGLLVSNQQSLVLVTNSAK
nr:exportin-2 [Tanacetum cinerariifolium]